MINKALLSIYHKLYRYRNTWKALGYRILHVFLIIFHAAPFCMKYIIYRQS